ncbi:caspase family protein [Pseudosulfitobacter koreensis]|uniref:Caspase family protein n=1 Tax=Pseudosulfitobacter koreensis TaxID=2968472 RepID=A0ABT1Z2H6_9RHOB|nr:caspase family protein [Pseudosulfitobacter koreense]MCR8827341.1 caspase family protein [Pseudosulfitobacter koreense]
MGRLWVLIVTVSLLGAAAVQAQDRIALVIGNGQYAQVAPLDNATNDARLITQSIRDAGFTVTLLEDAAQTDMRRAIADFGQALRDGGPETVGLFYYAGHGVQSFGANYLLPVDAGLTDAADLDLVAMDASAVLRQMASARNRTNIVILDACRNNPFENIRDLDDNGLAEMKAPTGTYLAYATAPGAVALDGTGQNSPFTAALAEAIQTEGAPIERVFKDVRVQVIAQTGGAQTPWDTSSLTREFVFHPTRQLSAEEVAERQLWDSVAKSRDPVQIMLFMRSYPDGLFQEEARAMLADVLALELEGAKDTEPVAAAPVPKVETPPAETEVQMLERARVSGLKADYQAYLDAYPDGTFKELVRIEIAGLEAKETEALVAVVEAPTQAEPVQPLPEPFFFSLPLRDGPPEIVGKTILEITELSPLYPPIEGLPDAAWKNMPCSTCHQWTRDALCTQATTYLKDSGARALSKEHPFGGGLKRNLRLWAQNDCQ